MKWHYLLVSTCLAILAGMRAMDGKIGASFLLAIISAAYMWGFYKSSVSRRKTSTVVVKNSSMDINETIDKSTAKKIILDKIKIRKYIDFNKKVSKNWLILAIASGGLSLFGYLGLRFPPLSLLMIFIGMYCTIRYRSTLHLLKEAKLILNNLE